MAVVAAEGGAEAAVNAVAEADAVKEAGVEGDAEEEAVVKEAAGIGIEGDVTMMDAIAAEGGEGSSTDENEAPVAN